MKKIKFSFKKLIKFIKSIKISNFFKDSFVISVIFFGVLVGFVFFYYTNSKIGFNNFSENSLFGVKFGYAYFFTEEEFYKNSSFLLLFSLVNIIMAKFVYSYDILAAYILIVSVPVLNIIYFLNTVLLFSFS